LRRSVDDVLPRVAAAAGAVFAWLTENIDFVNGRDGSNSWRVESLGDELGCCAWIIGVDAMGGAGGEWDGLCQYRGSS
jgi:hypothetical protein